VLAKRAVEARGQPAPDPAKTARALTDLFLEGARPGKKRGA